MTSHVEDTLLTKEIPTRSFFWDIIGHLFLGMPKDMSKDVIVVKEWESLFH